MDLHSVEHGWASLLIIGSETTCQWSSSWTWVHGNPVRVQCTASNAGELILGWIRRPRTERRTWNGRIWVLRVGKNSGYCLATNMTIWQSQFHYRYYGGRIYGPNAIWETSHMTRRRLLKSSISPYNMGGMISFLIGRWRWHGTETRFGYHAKQSNIEFRTKPTILTNILYTAHGVHIVHRVTKRQKKQYQFQQFHVHRNNPNHQTSNHGNNHRWSPKEGGDERYQRELSRPKPDLRNRARTSNTSTRHSLDRQPIPGQYDTRSKQGPFYRWF